MELIEVEPVISVKNAYKSFGKLSKKKFVLKNLQMTVEKGTMLVRKLYSIANNANNARIISDNCDNI